MLSVQTNVIRTIIILITVLFSVNVQSTSVSVFEQFFTNRNNIGLQKEIQNIAYETANTYLKKKA